MQRICRIDAKLFHYRLEQGLVNVFAFELVTSQTQSIIRRILVESTANAAPQQE
jgi:hypothetical protein